MDAKSRDLVLLTALSLSCAGFAWSWGHVISGSVFFVLGVAAVLGIAERRWGADRPPEADGAVKRALRWP
jgi:hypothetical protein